MQPVKREPTTTARGKERKGKDLLEDSEGESSPTETRGPKPKGKDDLFNLGGDDGEGPTQVESPTTAGEATMDQLRRDQMSDFVDGLFKLDEGLGAKTGEGALI